MFLFLELHVQQAATRLSGSPLPPREVAITWSAISAWSLQYLQVKSSLFKTHIRRSFEITPLLASFLFCFVISWQTMHIPLNPCIFPHGLGFVALPIGGVVIVTVYRKNQVPQPNFDLWQFDVPGTPLCNTRVRQFYITWYDCAPPITII